MATIQIYGYLAVATAESASGATVQDAAAALPITAAGLAAGGPYPVAVVQPGGYIAITIAAQGSTVGLWRVEPGGREVEVRGSRFVLSSGQALAFDYEAPFDVPVRYVARAGGDEGLSDEVVLPSFGQDWLRSLSTPSQSIPVTVVSFDDKKAEGRASLYQVHGRRLPVAVTDVMTAYAGQLVLFAEGTDTQLLEELFADGSPLMLHTPPENGEDRFYFVTTALQISRVSRLARNTGRYVTAEVAEVDASRLILGTAPAQYTWDELAAAYDSWDDVVADFASWRDVKVFGVVLPGV